MPKRIVPLFLALVGLVALPAAALAADDVASVKKAIVDSHIKAMTKAFQTKDVKVMMAIVADDYVGTDEMGHKVTKAAMEKMMTSFMKDTKKVNSYTYSVSGLKVTGNRATGRSTFVMDAAVVDSQGMMGEKGKTHRMKMEESYNCIWTKNRGVWQTSSETPGGQSKMELDGKPFNFGAPPSASKKK